MGIYFSKYAILVTCITAELASAVSFCTEHVYVISRDFFLTNSDTQRMLGLKFPCLSYLLN